MATRSFIGKKLEDGSVRFIYCHYDGYPTFNGRLLRDYYNLDNIDKLLDLGDLSSLGERIEPTGEHSFENREKGVCVAYGRDRHETGCESSIRDSENAYFNDENDWDIEFKYLLDTNGTWYCYDTNREVKTLLTEAIEREEQIINSRE